ncbi:IPT/TIG domain-containing protein, partial [Myxococcus qinghaiensis]|uniref:IPT/TIG domain-containing protein n=1 Tax=Myxococcus qinghaiensis TaxID=2906758 RepID=UPI0020A6E950
MKRALIFRRVDILALWFFLLLAACGGEGVVPQPDAMPAVASVSMTADAGPPIQYAYDEVGRLIVVYDKTGASAHYVYDEGGNTLEVRRVTASDLAIYDFAPKSGPVGTQVTITGSGFNTTPANNTVKLNGLDVIVNAANSQRLVVTLPTGAATGKLSVTTAGQTEVSREDLVIADLPLAPSISGFSPQSGQGGAQLTISGTGFSLDPINNRVFVGDIQAHVTSATPTQLVATVSSVGATGRVRVSTPHGRVTSSQDFIMVQSNDVPSSTDLSLQAVVDGPSMDVEVADGTRKALVVFHVSRSEQVSIAVTALTLGGSSSASLRIYDPAGTLVSTFSVYAPGAFDLPPAQKHGLYTAVLQPGSGAVGFRASLSWTREQRGAIIVDGAVVSLAGRSGRNGRYTFSGTAGEKLGLGVTSLTTTPSGQNISITILKPNGAQLTNCFSLTAAGSCNLPALPETGTYSIFIDPPGITTASLGLLLSRTVEG